MRYVTSMQDIINDVKNILASSEGEYDIEAIAYDVARERETQQLGEDRFYITEDEGEFWEAVAAHEIN